MAFLSINNVKIAGLSAGVPRNVIKTSESAKLSDEYDNEAYSKSTGVYERRYSDSLTVVDLAIPAINSLLADLNWESKDIDALVVVTQTPDYIAPSSACILQDKLGISKECIALDISLGCSGWVYGLSTLASMVSCGQFKKALLIAGDARQWHNLPIDALFGSAATVTALEYKEGETMQFHLGTDGSGWEALYVPAGGARIPFTKDCLNMEEVDGKMIAPIQSHMLGMDVFAFGITTAPKSIKRLKAQYEIDDQNVDYYVFHQANKLMVDTIKKKMKLSEAQAPLCMDQFGNTSSASIPLTIVTRMNDSLKEKPQTNLICCGFGIGLSWGSVYLKLYNDTIISKLVEVDD